MNQLINIQNENSSFVGTLQSTIDSTGKTYQIRLKKETLDDEIIDKQNIVIAKLKSDNNILKTYLSKAVLQLKTLKLQKQKIPDSQILQPQLMELATNLEAQNIDLKKQLEEIQSEFARYKDNSERQRDELQQEIIRLKREIDQNVESFERLQYTNRKYELEIKQKSKQIKQLQSNIAQLTQSNYQKQSFIDRFKILEDQKVRRENFRYLSPGNSNKCDTNDDILIEGDELLLSSQCATVDIGVQTLPLNVFRQSNKFTDRYSPSNRKNHHISPQTDKDQKIREYARQLTQKEKQCANQQKAFDLLKKENKKLEEKILEKEKQLKKQHKKYKKLSKKFGVSTNTELSPQSSDDLNSQKVRSRKHSKASIQFNPQVISNDEGIQTEENKTQKKFVNSQKRHQKVQKSKQLNISDSLSIKEPEMKQKRRKNRTIEADQQDLREKLKSLIVDLEKKEKKIQKLSSENTHNRQVLNETRTKLRKKENECKRLSKEIMTLKNQLNEIDNNVEDDLYGNIEESSSIKLEKIYQNEKMQTEEPEDKAHQTHQKPKHRRVHQEVSLKRKNDVGFHLSQKIDITEMNESNFDTWRKNQSKEGSYDGQKAQGGSKNEEVEILLPNEPSQEVSSKNNSRLLSQTQREELKELIDIEQSQELIKSLKQQNSVLRNELKFMKKNWIDGLKNLQKQYCSESDSDFQSEREIIAFQERQILARKIGQRFEEENMPQQNRNEEKLEIKCVETQTEEIEEEVIFLNKDEEIRSSNSIIEGQMNQERSDDLHQESNSSSGLSQEQKDVAIYSNIFGDEIKVNIKFLQSSQIHKDSQQIQISCIAKTPQKGIQLSERNENLFQGSDGELRTGENDMTLGNSFVLQNKNMEDQNCQKLKNQAQNLQSNTNLLKERITQLQTKLKELNQELEQQKKTIIGLKQQQNNHLLAIEHNIESSIYPSYMTESDEIKSKEGMIHVEVQTQDIKSSIFGIKENQTNEGEQRKIIKIKQTLSAEVLDEENDFIDVQQNKQQTNHLMQKKSLCKDDEPAHNLLNARPPLLPHVTNSHKDLMLVDLRATESQNFIDENQQQTGQSVKKSIKNFQQSVVRIFADSEMLSSKYPASQLASSQCFEKNVVQNNGYVLNSSKFRSQNGQDKLNEKQRQKLTQLLNQFTHQIMIYKQELLLTHQINFKLQRQIHELTSRVNQFKKEINLLNQQLAKKDQRIQEIQHKLQETNDILIRIRSQHEQVVLKLQKYVNDSIENLSPDKQETISSKELRNYERVQFNQILRHSQANCDQNKESNFSKRVANEKQSQTDHMAISLTLGGPQNQTVKQTFVSEILLPAKCQKQQLLTKMMIHETQSEILRCKQCMVYSTEIKRLEDHINRLNAEMQQLLEEETKKQEIEFKFGTQNNLNNGLPFIEQIDITPQIQQTPQAQDSNKPQIKITSILIPQNQQSSILSLSQQQIILNSQETQQLNQQHVDDIFTIENLTHLPYICYQPHRQLSPQIVHQQDTLGLNSSRNSSLKDSKRFNINQQDDKMIEKEQKELQDLYQPALVVNTSKIQYKYGQSEQKQNQYPSKNQNIFPLIFVESKTTDKFLQNQQERDIFNPLFITSQIQNQMTIQSISPFYREINQLLVENYLISNPSFESFRQFVTEKLSYLGLYVFKSIAKLKNESSKKVEVSANSESNNEQFLLDDDYLLKNNSNIINKEQKRYITAMVKRITDILGPHFLFLKDEKEQLSHEDFLTIALEIEQKYLGFKAPYR